MTQHRMTKDQYDHLVERVESGQVGPDFGFVCDADPDDHLHVRRSGNVRDGLAGRVSILTHGPKGIASVLVAADEARMVAAAILHAADELDGVTPLVFFPPRFPDPAQDPDAPEIDQN